MHSPRLPRGAGRDHEDSELQALGRPVLVDAHTHLGEMSGVSLQEEWSLLRGEMKTAGVDHVVVITADRPGRGPRRPERVLELLKDEPFATVVEGIELEGEHATDMDAAQERLRKGLTKGIKFYPAYEPFAINDPRLGEYFELAAHCKAPVLFHTGDTADRNARVRDAHPLLLDEVATAFPDTTFVMCHAGNPWLIDAAQVLHKNDNVVADISGFVAGAFQERLLRMMQRRLNDLIAYVEDCSGRLMFGSDWPLATPAQYLRLLDGLDLDDKEVEGIRWGTAQRVFGLPEPVKVEDRPSHVGAKR